MEMKNNKRTGTWKILYKEKTSNSYSQLLGEPGFWYADPFLFRYQNELFLFSEAFYKPNQIGHIAVSKFENGSFSVPTVIIRTRYHKSYPCVFALDNRVFMVPETSQNGTLELWESRGSMFRWEKRGDLLTDVFLEDSTVYVDNEDVYLFSYEGRNVYKTHVFKVDINQITVTEIENILHQENNKRPAGRLFTKMGKLFRPVQNNVNCYGESILLNEVKSIVPFQEEFVTEIRAKMFDTVGRTFLKTHTCCFDEELEVYDAFEMSQVSLWNRMELIRHIRNRYYRARNRIRWRIDKYE